MPSSNLLFKLNALYWANDNGCTLSAPMKMYRGFLINKINESNDLPLKRLAWRVTHVVTGIFAYPFLCSFAGIEMAFKLLNWNMSGKKHNQDNDLVKFAFLNVHDAEASRWNLPIPIERNSDGNIVIPGLKVFREYKITFGPEKTEGEFNAKKKEFADEMKSLNDRFTRAYTQLYVQYCGKWSTGMKFTFLANDSTLPYCSNPLLPLYKKVQYPEIGLEQNLDSQQIVPFLE